MRDAAEKAESRRAVLAELGRLGIDYEMIEHEAAYTVEDMDRVGFDERILICKNLFVRDQRKKPRHWLVVLPKDKRADLDGLAEQLGTKHLSFASEERLGRYLGLGQGEVTPLGIFNDRSRSVTVVFDRDLVDKECLGVHPNDNTATLALSFSDILKFISEQGNTVKYVTLSD
ncbi:MAG: prolyl-tRNA synthetase associated domain-containing protein [Aminivibrio sp.]